MNERYPYDFEKYNSDNPSQNQEIKTSQNLETIEKLFGEWDDEDKNTSESFSLNNQSFDNGALSYEPKVENDYNPSYQKSSPDASNDSLDALDQTMDISGVDLEELKARVAELHELYDDAPSDKLEENPSQSQSKGKSLVKATKQGIAFSNGSLTRTFLDCAVLCFVTASMGFVFLMNIINHI